jgi:hypothetical protein
MNVDDGKRMKLNIGCENLESTNNIVSDSLTVDVADANNITCNLLTLNNQASVPNAPINASSFFSTGLGNLTQVDPLGSTTTYATTASMGSFLPLDGSLPMTGDLDMGTNNLLNANSIVINDSIPANPPVGKIAIYSQSDGLNSLDSLGNVRQYLNGGDPVIIVNPVSAVVGNLPTFSTVDGKELTDSNVAIINVLRADGSVPMTGNLNVGSNDIDFAGGNINNMGNLFATQVSCARVLTSNPMLINGINNAGTGFGVAIGPGGGNRAYIDTSFGTGECVAIGSEAKALNLNTVAVGSNALATQPNTLALGSGAEATQSNTIGVGTNAKNNFANTCLLGDNTITSIRADSNALCDLGLLTTNEFRNLFVTNIDGNLHLINIGTLNASGVTIGRPTTNTVIQGKGYVGTSRPILSGGYSMITPTTIGNTVTETSMIGAGVGTLTSAANSQQPGNAQRLTASGTVNISASPTLTLRSYGGPAGTTLISTFVINLSSLAAAPSAWKLITEGTVLTVGAAGVASIQLNSQFSVFDTSPVTYVNQTLNNTTYDTTTTNIFRLTAQWGTANVNNVFITNLLNTNTLYVV